MPAFDFHAYRAYAFRVAQIAALFTKTISELVGQEGSASGGGRDIRDVAVSLIYPSPETRDNNRETTYEMRRLTCNTSVDAISIESSGFRLRYVMKCDKSQALRKSVIID